MRSLILLAPALLVAMASGPAQSAGQYGAQYGGQGPSPVWEDVPPVALDVPGRAPVAAAPAMPPASAWHDHADRGGWQRGPATVDRGAWQQGAASADRSAWQERRAWHGREGRDQHAGWSGRRPGRGWTLPSFWMSPAYAVSNWDFYGLGRPDRGEHWVRYYDDALLVDDRGTVLNTVDDLDWDRPASNYAEGGGYSASSVYGYGARYGGQAVGSNYAPPSYPMRVAPPPVAYAQPLVTTYAGPGYSTTTIIQAPPVVTTTTTTTTTYVDEVVASPRVYHAAPRRVVHRRRITCCCLCR